MTSSNQTPPTPLRDIETSTLGNGLRVITEVMTHVRSVSVGVWVGSGSRRETAEQNGISHFIEHMLFKGTTSRSAEDIARSVDSIGGNLDAFTSKELVCFNTKVLDQHLEQAFDVLADLVLHPTVPRGGSGEGKGRHPRGNQDGGGFARLPGARDFHRQLLEGSCPRQADPGHAAERAPLRQRHACAISTMPCIRRRTWSSRRPETSRTNACWSSLSSTSTAFRLALTAPAEETPGTHARIALRNKKSLEQVHLCMGVPSYPLPHGSASPATCSIRC